MLKQREIFVQRVRRDEDIDDPHKALWSEALIPPNLLEFLQSNEASEGEESVEELFERLFQKHIQRLEAQRKPKVIGSRGDGIYEDMKEELESKYMGKIVAIDLDERAVVGLGDNVEEAYEDARANRPQKKQFYFRLVGKSYLERFG